ncbi:MAG: EamA family transporter RarD [Bdellovibrionota bacterium]
MIPSKDLKLGMLYAFLAYLGWGFFPIYWKFLNHVPLLQILSHRVLWAFVFYTLILIYKNRKLIFFKPENKKTFFSLTLASMLLMGNWLVYIYSINSNQIVESSLGYFINPLVNILVGVLFLKERLSKYQTTAVVLAAIGVLIISLDQRQIPWIALFLAISFSCYGLIKKLNPLSGLKSNQFESFIFFPIALAYLLSQPHDWVTPQNIAPSVALLVGSGVITGLPLVFFAEATRRLPYYLMGFFQFLSPTLQFLSGVLIFSEPLSNLKLKGFAFIWLAGIVLILNMWLKTKHRT